MLAESVHLQAFSDAPTLLRNRSVEDNTICFARGATQCTQADCNVPLDVALAPALGSTFEIDVTFRLEPDSSGEFRGGYVYARSLILNSTSIAPRRFFAVYVRPRQLGLRVFYATFTSITQEVVSFPNLALDDGAIHNLQVQVQPVADFRGVSRSKVVVIVDGTIVERHMLVGDVADCGGSLFGDCVTYLGGRALEGTSAAPGLTAFEMDGCMSSALLIEPSRPLPTIPPQFDLLAPAVNVNDVSAQRSSRNVTCVMPTAATYPAGFGPPLTVHSFPIAGLTFSVAFDFFLPENGFGYLLAKSGAGSLRFYSLYVRRDTGFLVFYYKIIGSTVQQRVTLTDFSLANNTLYTVELHVIQSALQVSISTDQGSMVGDHPLAGLVDDCDSITSDSAACSLHVGERAGGRFELSPFGCFGDVKLFPDGSS